MIRKLVLGVLFASLSGALIYGGIYRTSARLETGNESAVSGQRRDASRFKEEFRSEGLYRNDTNSGGNIYQGGGNRGSVISDEGPVGIDEIRLEGTVIDLNADYMLATMVDGKEISVENRAWWYARQAGFVVKIGDQVELFGFFDESGLFEVSQITNLTNGITVDIRDESGRPYWAGNGGGRGQGGRSG